MKKTALTFIMVLLAARAASAQDSLAAARDLYSAAAYDEALAVLDRLDASKSQAEGSHAINEYRAFCLLALGRTTEAEHAIEAFVSAEPLSHPSESEASPRVRTAFTTVRRRMLPTIVQQKYAQAKTLFDQKDYTAASAAFNDVLEALADPDLSGAADEPPLSDMRTLAAGFKDLSAKAAPPPPAPPPALAAVAAKPAPPVADPNRIYSPSDTDVVITTPVVVRQDLPPFPHGLVATHQGILEVIINAAGEVETAKLHVLMNPRYDEMVLSATRLWKYKPATVAGTPVKFRKLINISVQAWN